ncbi:hypothetical protein DPMN_032756 [Dreissena polymorpha]|uniref:Uncharacterized protein n=1 Tax=Dreissena polymorpha TaxID=45954 RepID=A0A9D4M2D7_DREPO|nr:hypothetical protein DPMN_032756 [Dreissena polymorpha]
MKAGSVLAEPRQSPGIPSLRRHGAIPASDTGRASATPRFNSGHRRKWPDGAPVNANGVPAERRFTYVP